MKFIRIIILVALVVSFMPLDAFCDDHAETTKHCHGIVHCQAHCNNAVLTSDANHKLQDANSYSITAYDIIYEAPVLPTEERPPLSYLS
jgi:hypothetical protein